MPKTCEIFRMCELIKAGTTVNVAYLGGSLTVAEGAGNTATTSWRRLFTRYMYDRFHKTYHCRPSEVMAGIGGLPSYGAAFTIERNVRPYRPALVFVEFCVNDYGMPEILVRKGLEGVIRQLKNLDPQPDVVLLGTGCRPGADIVEGGVIDHSIHREIADYYGLPFIDVHTCILGALEARGHIWNDVAAGEEGDDWHLNDYGNALWFECLREWFEKQWSLHDMAPTQAPDPDLPPPLLPGAFQNTKLINPAKRSKQVALEGSWTKKDPALVPWYLDNLLVGRPGDKLTFSFNGTDIGAFCLNHGNGLKIEARLDGREISGPYTTYFAEYGHFFMLGDGMEDAAHVLELEVGKPMAKQNKLADPTAEIGYLTVATALEGA